MAFLFLVLTTLFIVAISSPLFNLIKNYTIARKIGFPILFTPISLTSPLWALCGETIGPLAKRLPFGLGNWADFAGFTVLFHHKYFLHAKFGPVYTVITPGDIRIFVADAAAAEDLLSRRKEFIKPPALYKPLEIFGPNVDSLNGEGWARHRRLTTPPFNERSSSNVWRQSLAQATGMLDSWTKAGKTGIIKTKTDTTTLALHVLLAAGFGKAYSFGGGDVTTKLPPGHLLSYREAQKVVLSNLFVTIIMTSLTFPSILLPRKLLHAKNCIKEFKQYLVEMVEDEKRSLKDREEEKDNLLSVLVRMSEAGATGRQGLSDEEIYGNLFIYTLAGHDTTANTLAYAIILLSMNLGLQAWIREEINAIFEGKEEVEDWEYEVVFPRLKRCLGVLFETLRIYGPVFMLPKHTGDNSTTLTIQGKDYFLPPGLFVITNALALQTLPSSWGLDSLTWKPKRWILNPSPSNLDGEQVLQPEPGTFIPWASGPRVCPGKKFAQVEFVAVLARLFRRHSVRPVLEEGETAQQAKDRIMDVVKDSFLDITLQIRNPEKIRLVWEEVA